VSALIGPRRADRAVGIDDEQVVGDQRVDHPRHGAADALAQRFVSW
jgi:hypothetical protein